MPSEDDGSDLAVFGYVGRGASNAMRGRLADFTELLGESLAMEVNVFEAASYSDLAMAIVSGFVDLAWLPPIPFIRLQQRRAVIPLVAHQRDGQTHFHSAVIVRTDSPLVTVADLRGARPAWVDTDSASGYVMPRVGLAESGLDPRTAFAPQRFCGSHEAVVRAVVAGRSDFGATYFGVDELGNVSRGPWLDVTDEKGRPAEVRVLARFGTIPGDTTAARVGLPAPLRDRVSAALQALPRGRENRTLLRRLFGVDEFRPWESSGHDELRRLTEDALQRGIIDEVET
jgi:phosphonate transport system substrate-binding protein